MFPGIVFIIFAGLVLDFGGTSEASSRKDDTVDKLQRISRVWDQLEKQLDETELNGRPVNHHLYERLSKQWTAFTDHAVKQSVDKTNFAVFEELNKKWTHLWSRYKTIKETKKKIEASDSKRENSETKGSKESAHRNDAEDMEVVFSAAGDGDMAVKEEKKIKERHKRLPMAPKPDRSGGQGIIVQTSRIHRPLLNLAPVLFIVLTLHLGR